MRTPENCPFEPGSDRVPTIWVGRVDELNDFTARVVGRRAAGVYERGRLLLGEPGIGKSVLANRIAEDARAAGHVVAPEIRFPKGAAPAALLAESLLAAAADADLPTADRTLGDLLGRIRRLTLPTGAGVELAPGRDVPWHRDATHLVVEIARALGPDRVLLLRLDEVQNVTDAEQLSQLLVAIGDALAATRTIDRPGAGPVELSLPLAVYLTGLPEFVDQATSEAGSTFARRFRPMLLGPLDDADVRAALHAFLTDGWVVVGDDGPEPVYMTEDAVDRILARCLGDPFLFQLVGQTAWDAGTGALIDGDHVEAGWRQARQEAARHVERQLHRLPQQERALLEAMVGLPEDDRTASRIAAEMGYDAVSRIGTPAARLDSDRGLIERGKPYRFRVRTVEAYLAGTWP